MSRTGITFSLAVAAMLLVLPPRPAQAFWGFGSGGAGGGSGLDLVEGYDRNTVVTLEGRVAVPPDRESDPVTVELTVAGEQVVVVLGPLWYLQHDDLDWKAGDNITVRGSKARGHDGRTYLLTQWINTPAGRQLVLRSDGGRPGWSGGFRSGMQPGSGHERPGGAGPLQRGDAGRRGMR